MVDTPFSTVLTAQFVVIFEGKAVKFLVKPRVVSQVNSSVSGVIEFTTTVDCSFSVQSAR